MTVPDSVSIVALTDELSLSAVCKNLKGKEVTEKMFVFHALFEFKVWFLACALLCRLLAALTRTETVLSKNRTWRRPTHSWVFSLTHFNLLMRRITRVTTMIVCVYQVNLTLKTRSWMRCWTRGRVPSTSLCSWLFLGRSSTVRTFSQTDLWIPLDECLDLFHDALLSSRYRSWRHHSCRIQTFWPQRDWLRQ